jgi:hypothetical protein
MNPSPEIELSFKPGIILQDLLPGEIELIESILHELMEALETV